MTNNTEQGADVLANTQDHRVVIPRFFRGNYWDHTNFPPKEGCPAFRQLITRFGRCKFSEPDLLAVMNVLKTDSAAAIGVTQ